MPKALFTKTITTVYQYETEVDDIETFYENRYTPEIIDSFDEVQDVVDVTWDIDVEAI